MTTQISALSKSSDDANTTGELINCIKNPKKDRKTKKGKGKIQSKNISPPSPTYVSSVFKPDPPDANKSKMKVDPSRLADTRDNLFGAWNEVSQDVERLMRAAGKRAQHDTHEEIFGQSVPAESPRAQKPIREDTMKNLFGDAEPVSIAGRRRWEDDSHRALFGIDSQADLKIARPRHQENTKDNVFPVGEPGVFDATYPWRRRPKRRPLLREDTQTSLYGLTTGPQECPVPLVRRASSPSAGTRREMVSDTVPQQQQPTNSSEPTAHVPTTHENLFGMPSNASPVNVLRMNKFLPVQLHRVESPKTLEHVFPAAETSPSRTLEESRNNSQAEFRLPIRLHRVESPRTYLYGQPDELANKQIQAKTIPERYTSKNPKSVPVSQTHSFLD